MNRLLRAVPAGTLVVGAGLVVLGAASYIHVLAANHTLAGDVDGQASVSVLWSLVFSIGIGLFMPVEQEVARLVAARSHTGDGAAPVLRVALPLGGGMLVVLVAGLIAWSGPVAGWLFDGDRGMVWALCGALAGLAAGHLTRGVLAGLGLFGLYGTQLAVDGGLRIVVAVGLAVAGVRSPVAFAAVLAVAPLVSVLLTLSPVLRALRPGTPVRLGTFGRGLVLLVASSLLAQLVINIGVVTVRIDEPGEPALVTALLAALILARVPLFVFASLQASLVPALSRCSAAGDTPGFRTVLSRAVAVVLLLGAGGAAVVVTLGPWLVRGPLAAPDLLGRVDFGWLAGATVAYMVATVLGQAVMARGGHGVQAAGWLAGTVVLAAVTLGPGDVRTRVEVAFLVGSVVVIPVLAPFAWRRLPARATTPDPAPPVPAVPVD